MSNIVTWSNGLNNFKKHTVTEKSLKKYDYHLEIIDQDIDTNKTIIDIFYDHIKNIQTKKVEMLFSGGVDSEFVLHCLVKLKVPVTVLTMRLMFKGCPLNTHDLYYSEKYCRENNLEQKFLDLDLPKFFENDYLNYIVPYNINYFHVATHFWMISQCDYFPIFGGNHTWPWTEVKKVLSPQRYQNNMHDKFMKDNNIDGIGNMLMHSYESNFLIVKTHLDMCKNNNKYGGDDVRIIETKKDLYEKLEPNLNLTPRIKTYGWENILPVYSNRERQTLILNRLVGHTSSRISWGKKMAEMLDTELSTNNEYE